jgi:hypothetical protein
MKILSRAIVSVWGKRAPASLVSAAVLVAISGFEVQSNPVYFDRGMRGLNGRLVSLLRTVEQHYGRRVVVVSGCRSWQHNRRVHGARHSYHLRCMAADIVVPGVSKSNLAHYLLRLPGRGGFGRYCGSDYLHIDLGPRREWYWGCGKKHKAPPLARIAKR